MFSSPPSFLLLIFHFSYFPKCRTEHRETRGRSRQRWRFGGENTQSPQNLLFRFFSDIFLHSCNSVHSEVQEAGGKSCINKISTKFLFTWSVFRNCQWLQRRRRFFSPPNFPHLQSACQEKKETRRNSSSSLFFLFHGKTEYLGRRRKKWTKFNVSSLYGKLCECVFLCHGFMGDRWRRPKISTEERGKGVCLALAEEENWKSICRPSPHWIFSHLDHRTTSFRAKKRKPSEGFFSVSFLFKIVWLREEMSVQKSSFLR